ncbi:shikimate dehydrogenase [Leucobacter tenebrionis]|uniref:shikimate dehydrogenase n=1 Tax=Leucobacter tenebrionis TaxID=2873270 RepID=UPI001CA76AF7|nr:shikimate dehydrogenase [Leucobacter tenebrionis]QZY51057.1 shikimate dehydrogenase [Leucobacter tenebrionis]
MQQDAYLLGLVGTGTTPSLTPALHMAEGRAQGLSYVYRPIDLSVLGVGPERLPEILDWAERLGFDALNVTHPCKRSVIPHLDRLDPLAEALGAVNTVRFTAEGRIGHNTDSTGFERGFRTGLPDAPVGSVVLVGAGGAGAAVADALLRIGVERLVIVDLEPVAAVALAADLGDRHPDSRVEGASTPELAGLLADADGVVHCTPVGMHDHPGLPFDPALLRPELWVADIVYRPLKTGLLRAARAIGCRTLHGGAMAVGQAIDTFALVTGREADPERMHRQFQRLVSDDGA